MCQYLMGTCDRYNVLIYTVDTWGYNKVLICNGGVDVYNIDISWGVDGYNIDTYDGYMG